MPDVTDDVLNDQHDDIDYGEAYDDGVCRKCEGAGEVDDDPRKPSHLRLKEPCDECGGTGSVDPVPEDDTDDDS